jgi:hypothetical protein
VVVQGCMHCVHELVLAFMHILQFDSCERFRKRVAAGEWQFTSSCNSLAHAAAASGPQVL